MATGNEKPPSGLGKAAGDGLAMGGKPHDQPEYSTNERGAQDPSLADLDFAALAGQSIVIPSGNGSGLHDPARGLDQTFTGPAIWRNTSHDEPVTVTGFAGQQDGRLFFTIAESKTAIPGDELTPRPPAQAIPPGGNGSGPRDPAHELLEHLHRGGSFAYWWANPGKVSTWWAVSTPAPLPAGAVNLYFGVHPAAALPERWKDGAKIPLEQVRATIPDIAAVNCLFAEFDDKDHDGDHAATLAHVDALAAAPSVIVDSGGGYHAYWVFRAPFLLTTQEDRDRARRVQAAWVAYVGGDPGAKDLARVLRVPGSRNLKYDPPRPVGVLRADYGRLYNLPDLEALSRPAERPAPTVSGRESGNGRGPSEDAGAFWFERALDEYERTGQRNESGKWLALQLRDNGVSNGEAVMLAYQRRVQNLGDHEYTESEALATWKSINTQPARAPAQSAAARAKRQPTDKTPAGLKYPDEPPDWIGNDGQDMADVSAPTATGDVSPEAKPKRKKVKSTDLISFLTDRGYTFRLNLTDDSVEVNGERLSDVFRAKMRCQLRDAGLGKYLSAAEDAVISHAAHNAYHPVRAYLEGLTWDGLGHIEQLASHATDANGVFGLYLRKWLIGAVARVYTGAQNAVLVLDGPQGLGKSLFARWLCPLPKLFVDSYINPDDDDCFLRAIRSWVWEVSELGATTRRADVEALKGFLTREVFTVRAPYGHYDLVKPSLASFIGTVNNSSGIFSDPTGSRRFWATTMTALDWSYAQHVNRDQLWAEAHAAYRAGEAWTLTPEDAQTARVINEDFNVPDPVEDLLRKYYQLDPNQTDKWTSSVDILTTLQNNGLGGQARANAMSIAATLKRLGHEKKLKGTIRGYVGVW